MGKSKTAAMTADKTNNTVSDNSTGKKYNKKLVQLYVLAIIRFFGSEEKPIEASRIIEELKHIAEHDEKAEASDSTVYTCLRTLRRAFYGGTGAEDSAGKRIPETLTEFYGGTIHCYEKVTEKCGNSVTEKYIEVDAEELKLNDKKHREKLCYAFRGGFTDGEIQMLKASVVANQTLSADSTEHFLRELNRIRSASRDERKDKDERYYVSLHKEDKLGSGMKKQGKQKPEDVVTSRLALLMDAIREKRKVRMCYGSYGPGKDYTPVLQPDGEEALFSPFAVFSANGYFYLIAHAPGRGVHYRNYRIDRICSLEMTEERSEPLPDELKEYCRNESFNAVKYRNEHPVMYGGTPVRVRLKCKKEVLNNLVDTFGTRMHIRHKGTSEKENCYVVDVTASEEGILPFCLQYGEYCQVVFPESLVERICKKLDAMRGLYEK